MRKSKQNIGNTESVLVFEDSERDENLSEKGGIHKESGALPGLMVLTWVYKNEPNKTTQLLG
jgi:hypothetical protein